MLYKITGVTEEEALEILAMALPILRKHDAPTDINTVEIPCSVIVVDANGKLLPAVRKVTFGFPAFDNLRKENLQALAEELAAALIMPCYTLDAAVKAGFPPN